MGGMGGGGMGGMGGGMPGGMGGGMPGGGGGRPQRGRRGQQQQVTLLHGWVVTHRPLKPTLVFVCLAGEHAAPVADCVPT